MAYVGCVAKQVVMHSEARNRLLCECSGISELVVWLDDLDRRPGLDELESKLIPMKVNIPVLKECIGYAEDGYQRNVIKKTEHYELVAICWTAGQLTPIHDHVGSDCAFKIIDGVSTETTYQLNDQGLAYPVGVREYFPGEICAADEPDIHRISNNSDNELINLHVYTPPLHAYNVYKPAK
jgi:cysteine dioxygenase